jgi:hypothetical protein
LDLPRVESITYVCEKCEAKVEESLITGTATAVEKHL